MSFIHLPKAAATPANNNFRACLANANGSKKRDHNDGTHNIYDARRRCRALALLTLRSILVSRSRTMSCPSIASQSRHPCEVRPVPNDATIAASCSVLQASSCRSETTMRPFKHSSDSIRYMRMHARLFFLFSWLTHITVATLTNPPRRRPVKHSPPVGILRSACSQPRTGKSTRCTAAPPKAQLSKDSAEDAGTNSGCGR